MVSFANGTGQMASTTLSELVDTYALQNDISGRYEYQLRYAVQRFSGHLGRPANCGDLTANVVNEWLRSEQQSGAIGTRSRSNVRTSIMTLWKSSKQPLDCSEIRPVKIKRKAPVAWTFAELEKVANAARQIPGELSNGLKRSDYFHCLVWFAFETGLRRSDVFRYNVTELGADNRTALTQHKTGRVHVVEITKKTAADMRRLSAQLHLKGDPHWLTPFHWPHSTSTLYVLFRQIRTVAGVDPNERNRSLQHIRRTGATAVECAEPEGAAKYLGHAGRELAWTSYIDPRKAVQSRLPPVTRPNDERLE